MMNLQLSIIYNQPNNENLVIFGLNRKLNQSIAIIRKFHYLTRRYDTTYQYRNDVRNTEASL